MTMGNWNITIEGVGPHGNHLTHNGAPNDAEAHAARAVRDLVEGGHNVTHAMVHAGGGRVELEPVRVQGQPWKIIRSDGGPEVPALDVDALAQELRDAYMGSRKIAYLMWQDPKLDEREREAWRAVALAARR
jgi:hypothetical protein